MVLKLYTLSWYCHHGSVQSSWLYGSFLVFSTIFPLPFSRGKGTRVCCFVLASRDLSDLGVSLRDLFTHTHNRTAGKDEINTKASKHLWLRKHEPPHTHTQQEVFLMEHRK